MADASLNYDGGDLEALFDMPKYQRWIVDAFAVRLSGEAVELGAGIGAVTRHLLPHVEMLDVIEPSPRLAERLESQYRDDTRVHVFQRTLQHYLGDQPPRSRDSVVMVNVLEHIEDDRTALREIFRVLRPGGHAMIFVPALPSLFSKMDATLGHKRRYTHSHLNGLAHENGYRVVDLRYVDLLGILPWWMLNTICGSTTFDPNLARLYDRIGVPLDRRASSARLAPRRRTLRLPSPTRPTAHP